jgi:hypothetical protein
MSADGTYSFVYCGEIAVGIGVVTIQDSILRGTDFAGGRYSGVVTERPNAAGYRVVYDMFVPANVFLVQGAAPLDISHTRGDVTLDLPLDFDNGEPITQIAPPGKITLMIRRIPDEFAWYASGVKVTISPV